jgi:hypothetical protein
MQRIVGVPWILLSHAAAEVLIDSQFEFDNESSLDRTVEGGVLVRHQNKNTTIPAPVVAR